MVHLNINPKEESIKYNHLNQHNMNPDERKLKLDDLRLKITAYKLQQNPLLGNNKYNIQKLQQEIDNLPPKNNI